MDFRQNEPNQARPAQASGVPVAGSHEHPSHSKRRGGGTTWLRVTGLIFLFACTGLAVALILYLMTIRTTTQSKYVDGSEYQAVFLNGGQVYFGHITSLNNQYTQIGDIYYLQVNQQVQPNQSASSNANNNVSLVKLGCELHGPEDSMVINQSQVIFWENLKPSGKVAQAIATYKQQNPNGQNCNQTQSSSSTPAATPATPTPTPATTNTTTKK